MNELFYFISDEDFRKIIESDYNEMYICYNNGAYKGSLVLSGSIIESLLNDYLSFISTTEAEKEGLLRLSFDELINKCHVANILSTKEKHLSDVVRNYRNLIHPGRSKRMEEYPSQDDANVALSLVNMIIASISKKKQETYGYTADQIIRKIENDATSRSIWNYFIKGINGYEKESLLLHKLPDKYFDEFYDMNSSQNPDVYRDFFSQLYKDSIPEIQKKAAYSFLDILKNADEDRVLQYVNNFFSLEFLSFYEKDDSKMVIQHLIGLSRNKMSKQLLEIFKNFTRYLDDDDLIDFIDSLFCYRILGTQKSEMEDLEYSIDMYLAEEYKFLNDDKKDAILEYLNQLKYQHSSSAILEEIDAEINYLNKNFPKNIKSANDGY